ncbi:hypothetical protein [Tatumella ptyseos]|nr:hypothetical protein [Tatumella ptyseos]
MLRRLSAGVAVAPEKSLLARDRCASLWLPGWRIARFLWLSCE